MKWICNMNYYLINEGTIFKLCIGSCTDISIYVTRFIISHATQRVQTSFIAWFAAHDRFLKSPMIIGTCLGQRTYKNIKLWGGVILVHISIGAYHALHHISRYIECSSLIYSLICSLWWVLEDANNNKYMLGAANI